MLFDTALGRCGLAWSERGVVSASFDAGDDEATLARLRRRAHGAETANAPPELIAQAAHDIVALFAGAARDFSRVPLDLDGLPEFDREVWALTSEIPHGAVKTYGDLARILGDVGLSRRVGQALGRNPIPIIIPCHRVIGANGTMTGFSAPGGTVSKRRLLKIEGALEPDLFDTL